MANHNTVPQYSFATGVVSPGIRNRRDWQRIDAALSSGVNCTIGPTGGVRKRTGMRFIGWCLSHTKPIRQVTFKFSVGQEYELEFGDYEMRVYQNKAPVLNANGTVYKRSTPYSAQQAQEFTFAQERDTMYFAHWDLPLKKLIRRGHANWAWEDVFTDDSTSRLASPPAIQWYSDSSNGHNGYEYAVTSYRMVSGSAQESITPPSIASDPAQIDQIDRIPGNDILSCALWINTYKAQYGSTAGFPTIPAAMDLTSVTDDFDGRSEASPIRINSKVWALLRLQDSRLDYFSAAWSGSSTKRYVFLRFDSDDDWYKEEHLVTMNSSDKITWMADGISYAVYNPNSGGVVMASLYFRNIALAYLNADNPVSGRTKTEIYNSIISFVNNYNSVHGPKISNHVKWPRITGAAGYYVYRRPLGGKFYDFQRIGIVTSGTTLDFLDENVDETAPDGKRLIEKINEFDAENMYPALATFFQQRLVIGCTKANPTSIWGSRTGIYEDFAPDPTDPSASYEFRMASQQSDPLKAIIPLYTLAVLTSGGDFISTVTGAMNAGNVNFNQKSYNGSSGVQPVIVNDTALYVPVSQETVNSMAYSYEKDGFRHDSILFNAQHFTAGKKIVGLAYQRDPINLVWALLNDGTLLSCLYIPEEGFVAWTEHNTKGKVKSINVVPNQGNDELWLVVERTLGNGQTRQCLEVLEDMRPFKEPPSNENMFYVDCGLSGAFDSPVTTITGLEHLEGLEVAILADGSVVEPQTVRSGRIVLELPASVVHVGLSYRFSMETLDLETADMLTLRDTKRQVSECVVEVQDTRELWYACNDGDASEIVVQDYDTFGTPQVMGGDYSIYPDAAFTDGCKLSFWSESPVSSQVLSLVAEVDHGDS